MYFANYSANGKVTKFGIVYPHLSVDSEGYLEPDTFLIPFAGFSDSDFVELENGNVLLLSQFEVHHSKEDTLILKKGDRHNGFLLVMMSIFYLPDAALFETPFGSPPEKVVRFAVKRDMDSPMYHEYLFVIHKSKEYQFGYVSESMNIFFQVDLKWNHKKDEVCIKVSKPFELKSGFEFGF